MRTALLALAFLGFSLAQNADNGDCSTLQSGTAPTPTPNTPDAFARFEYYDDQAEAAPTPANYEAVFIANNAAIENNTDYLTYSELPSYDVNACAASCDAVDDCVSFNIYFLRQPSVSPGANCPNPEAIVIIHCALFSATVSEDQATNFGQLRGPPDQNGESFLVFVRGSNAYNQIGASGGTTVTTTATPMVSATSTRTVIQTVTQTVPRSTQTAPGVVTQTVTQTVTATVTAACKRA